MRIQHLRFTILTSLVANLPIVEKATHPRSNRKKTIFFHINTSKLFESSTTTPHSLAPCGHLRTAWSARSFQMQERVCTQQLSQCFTQGDVISNHHAF